VLALEGEPDGLLPPGWEVVAQRGEGLAERLASAFADVGGPVLLVGMDTPQVTADQLRAGLAALERAEAVFGPAHDGGFWAIGLREPDADVFAGVPMSRDDTGAAQRLGRRRLADPPVLLGQSFSPLRPTRSAHPARGCSPRNAGGLGAPAWRS